MTGVEQSAEQISAQRRAHLWRKGTSGNPRGSESKAARLARRDRIIAEWAEPFGGVASLKRVELDLLREAADLVVGPRPRTMEDRVRVTNTVSRVLAQVGFVNRRRGRAEPPQETLREYAARVVRERSSGGDDGADHH